MFGWLKNNDPWTSPLGDAENLDMIVKRGSVGVDLLIVAARPLDLGRKTLDVLAMKLRNYCRYVHSPDFRQEFGTPSQERVRIGLRSDWDVPAEIIDLMVGIAQEEGVAAEIAIFYEYPPPGEGDVLPANAESPPVTLRPESLFPKIVPTSCFDAQLPPDLANEIVATGLDNPFGSPGALGSELLTDGTLLPAEEGIVLPLGSDTKVILMWQEARILRSVDPEELSGLGLSAEQAHQLALANLARLDEEENAFQKQLREIDGRPLIIWIGEFWTASCLRLPYLYEWASAQLNAKRLFASIPRQQLLFLFPSADASFRGIVRQYIDSVVKDVDKRITDKWFELSPGRVTEIPETA